MIEQMSLFEVQPITSPQAAHGTPEERFKAFHEANPHVYQALRKLALQMRREGIRRYSMKGLFEVLRWQYSLQTGGDDYKLNNYFTSFYARLLMASEPRLSGFFETRSGIHVEAV